MRLENKDFGMRTENTGLKYPKSMRFITSIPRLLKDKKDEYNIFNGSNCFAALEIDE